jgi:hypothetical protein
MSAAVEWTIYGIGEPTAFGWAWRCSMDGTLTRQSVFMFSTIREAVEDAIANGMDATLHNCVIVEVNNTGRQSPVRPGGGASHLSIGGGGNLTALTIAADA